MSPTRRGVLVATALAAVATFACVQDRVTAAAARRYVAERRAAWPGNPSGDTLESAMTPGIRASVAWGVAGAAVVVAVGVVMSTRCQR